MKAVQFFSKQYLAICKKMSVEERLEYLDNFRRLYFEVDLSRTTDKLSKKLTKKSKLISIKMPESLISTLKMEAVRQNMPYQTLMKKLLREGLGLSEAKTSLYKIAK
jgi:predicted DNA binding CopG/RHH family protein